MAVAPRHGYQWPGSNLLCTSCQRIPDTAQGIRRQQIHPCLPTRRPERIDSGIDITMSRAPGCCALLCAAHVKQSKSLVCMRIFAKGGAWCRPTAQAKHSSIVVHVHMFAKGGSSLVTRYSACLQVRTRASVAWQPLNRQQCIARSMSLQECLVSNTHPALHQHFDGFSMQCMVAPLSVSAFGCASGIL